MSIAQYNNIFSKSFPKDILLEFSDETLIENDQICEEDMSLEESLCSDSNLKFGACESSCFKVRVVNNNNFKGLKLNVSMVLKGVDAGRLIDSDGNYLVDSDDNYLTYYDASNPDSATIDIGEYYVIDDEPSNDRMWRDLTCYDAMYFILNADVTAWYAGLTFPMSMKNFRDSFFTWINSNVISISQNTVTLINDNFMIQGGFEASQLSGKDVIESICELNACFGHIDRTGNFDYITLPSSETITYNWYIDGTGSYEDYVTDAITKVTARGEAEDVGTSVGVDGNTLIIENNPLIYGTEGTTALEDALDNILDAVDGFTYRPYEVQTYGNPMLPVGTSIVINTKRYDHEQGYQPFAINSFVMSRTLTGIQALKDSINASGDKERPSEVNSISSQIERTKGKLHIVKNTVDELSSEIYEIDPQTGTKTSKIQQLADEIVLKVTSSGRIVEVALSASASTGTEFKVGADNINLTAAEAIDLMAGGTINLTSENIEITTTSGNFEVDSYGNVTCKSLTARGTLRSTRSYSDGVYYTEVSGGSLSFGIQGDSDTKLADISPYAWDDDWTNKRGVSLQAKAKYFGLGASNQSYIVINNGLNPNSHTEKVIFRDTTRFEDAVTFDQPVSFSDGYKIKWKCATNDWAYIAAGAISGTANQGYLELATGDDGTEPIFATQNTGNDSITEVRRAYILDSNGNTSFPGNLSLTGYMTSRLRLGSANDYIFYGTYTIGSTDYVGAWLERNILTSGKVIATSHMFTKGIMACINDAVIIDRTSNNHVTDNNSYKGLRLYDKDSNFNYGEHFTAADTDGTIRSYMIANNMKTDGNTVYNQLGCGVKKDGTQYYYMTSPTAFRQAISVDGIGETTDNNAPGAQTCNSGVWKSVATITSLPAGKYLLIGSVNIDANSNGNRYADISTAVDGNPISRHAYVASKNASGKTALQMVCPINISSATTYHLNVYQDSGSQLSATGALTAIKIRG